MFRTAICFLLAAPAGFAAAANTLSLKVSTETAPAGSIVQMKLRVTEAKPIFTGSADFASSGFDSYYGLSLNDPRGDAAGVALMRAGGFQLAATSPSGALGTSLDYPIFTFAARLAPNAAAGAKYEVAVAPGAFLDLFGFQYPAEIKSGWVTVGDSVVISDVVPGSAKLPAGAQVTLRGKGFTPDTKIRFKETDVAATYVSSTEMRVTLVSPADMHGMMIKALNKSGSSSVYYSYQRTNRGTPTSHSVLARCEPIFARASWTAATFVSPALLAGSFAGFAFQNLGSAPATVTVELKDAFGRALASGSVDVPANTRITRSAGELISTPVQSGAVWRFTSTAPVQMLEIVGRTAPESARPVGPVVAR